MSVERNNHFADAEENLRAIGEALAAEVSPQLTVTEMIELAKLQAALALVEQQRIANLIALADHAHTRWGNYAGEAGGVGTLFSYPEAENGNMRIRDDIREALGLS